MLGNGTAREGIVTDGHGAEAQLHDRGLADDQLVEDHERDRFEGVTGSNGGDERRVEEERTADGPGATRTDAEGRPNTDYQQGRHDEAV